MLKIPNRNLLLSGLGLTMVLALAGTPRLLKPPSAKCGDELSLVGVSLGPAADRQAIIEIKKTAQQVVLSEGEIHPEVGRVEKISRKGIRLLSEDKVSCLLFFNSGGSSAGFHPNSVLNRVVALGRDDEFGMTRGNYETMVRDAASVWGSSQCLPIVRYGMTVGLQCAQVDQSSFIGKIGVLPGDLIESINSHRIRQLADALAAAAQPYAGRSTVEVERAGQKISLAVNIF